MKALKAWLLRKLLTFDELVLIEALRAPDRWQPDDPLTPEETEAFGALLRQPTFLKVDTAMVNMQQQLAQHAVHVASPEIVRYAGYAAGFRGAWLFAKNLSIASAQSGKTEDAAGTDAGGLDHLNP